MLVTKSTPCSRHEKSGNTSAGNPDAERQYAIIDNERSSCGIMNIYLVNQKSSKLTKQTKSQKSNEIPRILVSKERT